MQRHVVRFHVAAPRPLVWRRLHPLPPEGAPRPRIIEYPGGRIEILFEGNEAGEGLVRTCIFRVPKIVGSKARSWECIVEARAQEYSRYIAVSKPLWSHAVGSQELEDAPEGGTTVTFTETYEVHNPIVRPLEGYVHRFISRDNDRVFEAMLSRCGPVRRVS